MVTKELIDNLNKCRTEIENELGFARKRCEHKDKITETSIFEHPVTTVVYCAICGKRLEERKVWE